MTAVFDCDLILRAQVLLFCPSKFKFLSFRVPTERIKGKRGVDLRHKCAAFILDDLRSHRWNAVRKAVRGLARMMQR